MRKMYRDYVTRLLFSRKYMYMYCTLDNRSRNDNFNFTVSLSLSIYTVHMPDEAVRPDEDRGRVHEAGGEAVYLSILA